MTVATTTNRISYAAGGAQTVFAYPFKIFADADLVVFDNTTQKALTTDYTVSGAGSPTGGNVTFLVAPLAGHTVLIVRILAQTQGTDLTTNGNFPSSSVEDMSDRLTMLVQQLNEVDARALKLAITSSFSELVLPDPSASLFLAWNAAGTALVNTAGIAGPAGPAGPPGGGAAPTVREVDGAPSIGAVTALEFDQADGFVVTNPSGAIARVDLDHTAIGRSVVTAANAAAVRSVIAAAGLADTNLFTGRNEWAKGANLTAAATLAIGTDGNYFDVAGNTGIGAIANPSQAGALLTLHFTGTPLLTHSASLLLAGAVNYQVVAGDRITFIYRGASVWEEVSRTLVTASAAGASFWTDPETSFIFWEDFLAAISINAATFRIVFSSGMWRGNSQGTIAQGSNFRGTIVVSGDGANAGDLTLNTHDGAYVPKKITNVSQNPSLYMRWAQFGTGVGNRFVGYGDTALSVAPANGIYVRHSNAGTMTGVCRKVGVETTLSLGSAAANGVFHTARAVVTSGGGSVEFFLDGVSKGSIATNVPIVDLAPSMGGDAIAVADGVEVDYVALKQTR